MLSKRYVAVFGLVLALFALVANPARANVTTAAPATVDCNGFNLCVTIEFLDPTGPPLEFDYTFILTPSVGTPITVGPTAFTFQPTMFTQTECVNGTWPNSPLTAPVTVTGNVFIPTEGITPGLNPFTITFNGATSIDLMCSSSGGGCPATIGFWKNEEKHPFPNSVQTSGLTIGGVTYSAADLYTILSATGGNAVVILGKQLVGALLNLAAGAKHNASADMAIADAEGLLSTNSLNLLTSFVAPSSTLGTALIGDASILNNYNSADFNTCSENSGLKVGTDNDPPGPDND